jgi:Transglycosylase-like domain
MKKLLLLLLFGLAACTPQEVATFLDKPVNEVTEEEVTKWSNAWDNWRAHLQWLQELQNHPFLVCTRSIESGGNYRVVNPSGTYRGAYQFARSTWDSTARHAGRLDLVGVDPIDASPRDQDAMALHLAQWQGARPWLGRCANHL